MKLAFCVEAKSDQVALQHLASRILGEHVQAHAFEWRIRGWSNALQIASKLARAAYMQGVDGAIFAIDNDDGVRHESHERAQSEPDCRHCQLVAAARTEEVLNWPRPALSKLIFVFTVPIETLEAWLLFALDGDSTGMNKGVDRRKLKKRVYGHAQPTEAQMITASVAVIARADLSKLRGASPSFDLFCRDLLEARDQTRASSTPT